MIYLILCRATNMVKIGFAADPWKRISKIQSDTPHAVELLAVLEGDLSIERGLHQRFKAHWRRGEWFDFSKEIEAFAAALPTPIKHTVGKRLGGALGAWLYANKMTLRDFGLVVGSDKSSLSQICSGLTIPRKDLMRRIYIATHGAVQPNDFYDLSPIALCQDVAA